MLLDFLSWVCEQEFPDVRSGAAISAAAFDTGLVAGESPGAFRSGTGAGPGPVKDLRLLRSARWAGEGSLPSGDDGAGSAVRLLRWCNEFAAHGTCQLRRHSVSLSLRGSAPGSRHHSRLPPAAPSCTGAVVHAGTPALR